LNAIASGLRFGRDDRNFLSDQAVSSVDFPAFGRPTMATNPARDFAFCFVAGFVID